MLNKNYILSVLARYQYPQRIFGNALLSEIKASNIKFGTILDVPCGNGEVSYVLTKMNGFVIEAVDNDDKAITIAKQNFKHTSIQFTTNDIFSLLSSPQTYDVICIVNSFFLLPTHSLLLTQLKTKLKNNNSLLLIIIPNTESVNFLNFQKQNPTTNLITYIKKEFLELLTKHQFNVSSIKNIAHVNVYGRKELKYFSIFSPLYLLILSKLNSIINPYKSSYLIYKCTANFEDN